MSAKGETRAIAVGKNQVRSLGATTYLTSGGNLLDQPGVGR